MSISKIKEVRPQMYNIILKEGLEQGDLKRLLHPKIHIDEFTSKMGDDADILVLSFKLLEKQPANDLMSFIERGYDWVLDADISTGELDDGDYLVFVEMKRSPIAAKQIVELIEDILNLSDQKFDEWRFQYQKSKLEYPVSAENLRKIVPLTAEEYIKKYNKDDDINSLKESARVKITSKAPVNSFTESLRVIAGIK
jgi:hypothetical protein